jgi:putative endonuclease
MPYTYILYSSNLDRYYVGSTRESIEERLSKHNNIHKGFTSSANDWEVVFWEFHADYSEALAKEKKIKQWKSRKMIESLINNR